MGPLEFLNQELKSLTFFSFGSQSFCNQLEIEFEELGEVEAFWKSIPQDYHREWTLQMRDTIVDGSPSWTLHHIFTNSQGSSNMSNSEFLAKQIESSVQKSTPNPNTKEVVFQFLALAVHL